jgi:hypothetical protein
MYEYRCKVVHIVDGDKSINDYMIEKRHAVPYHGQSKEEIQEQHIKNREFHNL